MQTGYLSSSSKTGCLSEHQASASSSTTTSTTGPLAPFLKSWDYDGYGGVICWSMEPNHRIQGDCLDNSSYFVPNFVPNHILNYMILLI